MHRDKETVLVSVIAFNGIEPQTTEAFFKAMFRLGVNHSDRFNFALRVTHKREQHRARNQIIETALGARAKYIWQIDDDMIIRPDTFDKLLGVLESDPMIGVAGALYTQRDAPFHHVAMAGAPRQRGGWWTEYIPPHELTGEPMDVAVTGGGCFMFRAEPFEKMVKPYFFSDVDIGTDVQICLRLKDMGYRVVCDTGHMVGHVGEGQVFYPTNLPAEIVAFNQVRKSIYNDASEFLELSTLELHDLVAKAMAISEDVWYAEERNTLEEINAYYTDPALGDIWVARGIWFGLTGELGIGHYHRLQDLIYHKLFPKGRVLDYGCGVGIAAEMFARAGYTTDAMDLRGMKTLEFVDWRRKKHNLPVVVTPIKGDVPPLEETYSTIVCMDVLEHLTNPEEVVRKLVDHLEPGGYFFTDAHTYHFKGKEEGTPQHLKVMDNRELADLFAEVGLLQQPEPFVLRKRTE